MLFLNERHNVETNKFSSNILYVINLCVLMIERASERNTISRVQPTEQVAKLTRDPHAKVRS